MIELETVVKKVSMSWLIRLAIACTLTSLGFSVAMSLLPIPILIVLGMGISHGAGIVGVLLFGAAILREVIARPKRPITAASSAEIPRPPGE